MDIDILRELIVLSEKQNYAKAAEQLYISQSALSRHIAALEGKLKARLFERNPRQVKLTRYGEALIPFAREIIELEDESLKELDNIRLHEQSAIRIGSIHGLSNYGVMSIIAGFVAEHRDISVNIAYSDNASLKEQLEAGKIDLAIISEDAEKGASRQRNMTLLEDRLVVVLPSDHRLAERKEVTISDLADDEWIIQDDHHFLSEVIRDLTWGSGIKVRESQIHVGGIGALELVSSGLGIAIEQQKVAMNHQNAGLAFVPLSPEKKIRISLIWQKNISAPCELFIDHLRKNRR